MGCESNYRIKIPSKQLNKNKYGDRSLYSTFISHVFPFTPLPLTVQTPSILKLAQINAKVIKESKKRVLSGYIKSRPKLNPWFITGFVDAENINLNVKIQQHFTPGAETVNGKMKVDWRVFPVFSIRVHREKTLILIDIKKTLGVGTVRKTGTTKVSYIVESMKDLKVLINHFEKYPLISSKVSDFLLFKQCFEMVMQKKHKTKEGILKLMSLKKSLDGDISNYFKLLFPELVTLNLNKPETAQPFIFKSIPHPA